MESDNRDIHEVFCQIVARCSGPGSRSENLGKFENLSNFSFAKTLEVLEQFLLLTKVLTSLGPSQSLADPTSHLTSQVFI